MKIFLISGILCATISLLGEIEKAELSTSGCVKYSYLDNTPSGDSEHKLLTDGEYWSKPVHITGKENEEHSMDVLFEFPEPVSVEQICIYGHLSRNRNNRFNRVEYYAGDEAKKLLLLGQQEAPYRMSLVNKLYLSIQEPQKRKFFRIKIIQTPGKEKTGFLISEIFLKGSESDAFRLEKFGKKLSVNIPRTTEAYLYDSTTPINIPVAVYSNHETKGILRTAIKDYFKKTIFEKTETLNLKPGENSYSIYPGKIKDGYYTIHVSITAGKEKGNIEKSFVVAPIEKQSLGKGENKESIFGFTPNFSDEEMLSAAKKIGFNWINLMLVWGGDMGPEEKPDLSRVDTWLELCRKYNLTGFFDPCTFPPWSLDKPEKRRLRKGYQQVLPNKEKYQKALEMVIRKLPPEQKHFRLCNEPWGYWHPEDYFRIIEWSTEIIKKWKPDAVVTANVGIPMILEMASYGGLKSIDAVSIHPYSHDQMSSPESSDIRENVRMVRRLLREQTGRDLPVYVTEIGWATVQEGALKNTEEEQAAYTVRAILSLYAEQVKAILVYCLGQTEKEVNYREHFYGVIRKNHTPKPVFAALATVRRMIENSEYLGDLDLGTDVGAMLFRQKNGERILALYTDGTTKKISLHLGVAEFTRINLVGTPETVKTPLKKYEMTLTDDPVYLCGVGVEVEKYLMPKEKRTEWSRVYKRGRRICNYIEKEPEEKDWEKTGEEKIVHGSSDFEHFNASFKMRWNEKYFFLRVKVNDPDPKINDREKQNLWMGDSVEVFFSGAPEKSVVGFMKEDDYQILLAPFGKDGSPVAAFGDSLHKQLKTRNLKMKVMKQTNGYTLEAVFPFALFGVEAGAGKRLALDLAVNDICKGHRRVQINSNNRYDNSMNSSLWSELILEK